MIPSVSSSPQTPATTLVLSPTANSGPVFPYEHVCSNMEDSSCSLSSELAAQSHVSQRTPNVYVNGLPPHYPEHELFALARPYGEVKSVRTFTRHVSEKPTGYGFILFEGVSSAERCIEGLRKYRNLHPSFSKQVHRIPGTAYAQHSSSHAGDHDETTFKARMEKLKDESSTNLYIEGLPLSIDEESLAALMLPYKIKSSRFFKTKLSDPPRIIAFVRLETHAAAEQIIERLHGRMVRGWNDPGCRISVRFADSAEQRELRRAERSLRNGDQSPARLTIAQAALLNLRGKELQAEDRKIPLGRRHGVARSSRSLSEHYPSIDRTIDSGTLSGSKSLLASLRHHHDESPILSMHDLPVDVANMDVLIQAVQNMGYHDGLFGNSLGGTGTGLGNEYRPVQQAHLQTLTNASLSPSAHTPPAPFRGQTQARNGFTPAEELIIQAHAQMQLRACLSSYSPAFDQDIPHCPSSVTNNQHNARSRLDVNIPSFGGALMGLSQPAISRAPVSPSTMQFSHDTLPTISEDDFHAMSQQPLRLASDVQAICPASNAVATKVMRPLSRAVSIVPPPENPQHDRRPTGRQQRIAHSSDPDKPLLRTSSTDGQPSPYENQTQRRCRPMSSTNSNVMNIIPSNSNLGDHNERDCSGDVAQGDQPSKECGDRFYSSLVTSHGPTQNSAPVTELQLTMNEHIRSPVVVSPALTYSSRTPSTLSPATPFFGSFNNGQDTFDVMTMENEEAVEEKLKMRAGAK